MAHPHSHHHIGCTNIQIVDVCIKCRRNLKEIEAYYLGDTCSDCNHIENVEMMQGTKYNGNPNFYHNMGIAS